MAFETGEIDEFEFFLGEKLRKTIGEIEAIPHEEYLAWSVYFGRKAQRVDLARKAKRDH